MFFTIRKYGVILKVTKSIIAALFTCFMVSACSSVKQNDLVNVQMNESNYLVKDLERTYYVFEDQVSNTNNQLQRSVG